MFLRDGKVLKVDVREVQVGCFERFVDVRMIGDVTASLDDKNGERRLALEQA